MLVCDPETDALMYSLHGEGTGVTQCVVWDRKGECLASTAQDSKVNIWKSIADSSVILAIDDPSSILASLTWNSDGTKLAGSASNDKVYIWDMSTGKIINRFDAGEKGSQIAWSHDDKSLALTSAQGLYTYDLLSGKKSNAFDVPSTKREQTPGTAAVAWAHGNENLASGSNNGAVCIWDVRNTKKPKQFFDSENPLIVSVAWSTDDAKLAAASMWTLSTCIYNLTANQQEDILTSNIFAYAPTWQPNGSELAIGQEDGTVRIWEIPRD